MVKTGGVGAPDNKDISLAVRFFGGLMVALFVLAMPYLAQAQEAAADKTIPVQSTEKPATEQAVKPIDPLTVTGVIIDKTAENAVVAREEALADARRAAFRKLAEKNMSATEAADLAMPDDAMLATLVQDLEIKRERLSATRYVGDFTVRFRDGVKRFIPVRAAVAEGEDDKMASDQPSATASASGGPVSITLSEPVLLLPYLETMSGQSVLWQDPNGWRQAWQARPPKASAPVKAAAQAQGVSLEGKVLVPLGDIADVSAGPDSAVWTGDYSALEKMSENYGVSEIILAVANRSGPVMRVTLYSYRNGALAKRGHIAPLLEEGIDEETAYDRAAAATLTAVLTGGGAVADGQRPEDVVSSVSASLTGAAPAPTPYAGSGTRLETTMSFDSFMTWMETQKRLSQTIPRVQVDIQTISKNSARFTLGFEGSAAALTTLLAEKGLQLQPTGQSAGVYQLVLVP